MKIFLKTSGHGFYGPYPARGVNVTKSQYVNGSSEVCPRSLIPYLQAYDKMRNPSVKNCVSAETIYIAVGTAIAILATLLLYFISQATKTETF